VWGVKLIYPNGGNEQKQATNVKKRFGFLLDVCSMYPLTLTQGVALC
jgi:hypothetical protein